MATVVVMPKLGLTMTEGMIARWLVPHNYEIKKGHPIVEVMTEKITYEVEAPCDGVLQITVEEGETVGVGVPIATIVGAEVLEGPEVPAPVPAAPASAPESSSPADFEIVALSPLRKVIAERMTQSFRDVPQFVVTREVEMTGCIQFRQQINAAQSQRVSYNDIIVKAVARTLHEHRAVNASFENGQLRQYRAVNVGVAVAVAGGLIVPVVQNADKKAILDIAGEVVRLVEKARSGRLEEQDVTGGTFTLSNMGMFNIDLFTAIINPPQSAILAAGSIADRPYVVGGRLEVRPTCFFSLSCDHRVLDGAAGAAFLSSLKALLESPSEHLSSDVARTGKGSH